MGFLMKAPTVSEGDADQSIRQIHSWLYQLNENLKYMFSHLDEENFSADFMKSAASEVTKQLESLSSRVDEVADKVEKKEVWNTITLSGFSPGYPENYPAVKKSGSACMLAGGGSVSRDIAALAYVTVGKLPEGYRPVRTQYIPVCWEGGVFRMEIMPSGSITIRNIGSSAYTKGKYISLTGTYFI